MVIKSQHNLDQLFGSVPKKKMDVFQWVNKVAEILGYQPSAGVYKLYHKRMSPEDAAETLAKTSSHKDVTTAMKEQKEFSKNDNKDTFKFTPIVDLKKD